MPATRAVSARGRSAFLANDNMALMRLLMAAILLSGAMNAIVTATAINLGLALASGAFLTSLGDEKLSP